jgi:hypothetical protein
MHVFDTLWLNEGESEQGADWYKVLSCGLSILLKARTHDSEREKKAPFTKPWLFQA